MCITQKSAFMEGRERPDIAVDNATDQPTEMSLASKCKKGFDRYFLRDLRCGISERA